MDEADRKAFPNGFRKLSDEETALAKKRADLERQISEIDRSVADQLSRKEELQVLLAHGPAANAPTGEIIEIAKPDDPGEEDNSGFWVKE